MQVHGMRTSMPRLIGPQDGGRWFAGRRAEARPLQISATDALWLLFLQAFVRQGLMPTVFALTASVIALLAMTVRQRKGQSGWPLARAV
jgi:hypothetical protein